MEIEEAERDKQKAKRKTHALTWPQNPSFTDFGDLTGSPSMTDINGFKP